ncbi:MAG: hypothetical protein E7553_00855 [Ruminococcaceae bacterium]|nr:hypothetical protein [Oscillospiraceae bacterium]
MKNVKRLMACVLALAMLVSMMMTGGVMTASALSGVGCAENDKSILGIDLSYWNVGGSSLIYSRVDFDKLVASGCKFAILRIGLGSSSNTPSMDKAFLEYYRRARAAGMHLGVYFYSHALTYAQAAKEAKWCINVIESNNMYFEYPIYVDMEESDQVALGSTAFTNVALGFCDTMADAGYYAGFYGMHSSQSKLTSSFTSKYDRWTAKVKTAYDTSNQYTYSSQNYRANYCMWQFTWVGVKYFSGVTGNGSNLDVNICYKDYPTIMQTYGYNNMKKNSATTAEKLGTYYITAPSNDPLNVRDSASTSGNLIGETVQEGDIIDVTERSGNWGKFVTPKGATGWAAIANYSNYIGVDALAYENEAPWGGVNASVGTDGAVTLTNTASEQLAYDFKLPHPIGTATTPYFCIQIVPNNGNGYYFGLNQLGTGHFMMRDCTSGDQLVEAQTAPYMTDTETLEINLVDWWTTTEYQIDVVRVYLAANSSVTINYMYFAANSGVVKSSAYNLKNGSASAAINHTLMVPDTLAVVDPTKNGGYTYSNGMLAVTSNEDSGYDVVFNLNKDFDLNTVTRWLFSVESDVRFDVIITASTTVGDWDFGLCSDFYPNITGEQDNGYIPAMTGSRGLDFKSCFTWNNVLPENGITTVRKVTVRVGGKGTTYLSALQLANSDELVMFYDGITKSETTPAETPDDDERPTPTVMLGDLNDDGDITTADARVILQYNAGLTMLTPEQLEAANYNGDELISTMDVREMLRILMA